MKWCRSSCFRFALFLVLITIIACAIFAYATLRRRVVVPLTFDASQFPTNHVVACLIDNAHPGVVALGYNRKLYITALDLHATGHVDVLIVNCTSNVVSMGCSAGEAWDVGLPERLSPGESGFMSIWEKEGRRDSLEPKNVPDVVLRDENDGQLLCECYIKDGKDS